MEGRFGSLNGVQFGTGAPLNVQLLNKPIAFKSPVAFAGFTGLPLRSTVGTPAVTLALSTPGKNRKIPCWAYGVSVGPTTFSRFKSRSPSNNTKNKVLF